MSVYLDGGSRNLATAHASCDSFQPWLTFPSRTAACEPPEYESRTASPSISRWKANAFRRSCTKSQLPADLHNSVAQFVKAPWQNFTCDRNLVRSADWWR